MAKTIAERRARNAERQKNIRDARIRHGLCMTCGAPAEVDKATGIVKKQCRHHLRAESERKSAARTSSPLPPRSVRTRETLKAQLKKRKAQRFTDRFTDRCVELRWL
jgi:hypothetical protein